MAYKSLTTSYVIYEKIYSLILFSLIFKKKSQNMNIKKNINESFK